MSEKTPEHEEFVKHTIQKKVSARPMNLGDYNVHRGWEIPKDEDPQQAGFLVVDSDGQCETWMPKDVFERDCLVASPGEKTLHNSTVSGARENVKDIKVVGNGDAFRLFSKASSENEGFLKHPLRMKAG